MAMSSKTPRTLLENYLDASKTQTVKVQRNQHGSLIRTPPTDQRSMRPRLSRTPEPYIHSQRDEQHSRTERYTSITPEPYIHSAGKSRPQHNRVSTLRSKRRSVSSNNDVEETPRQMLQGFLESEDTTAPLVRYASRTSQGRPSSSQPAPSSSSSGRSSLVRPGNITVDIDYDTPRTLLQRYVLNTTDVIDTPAPRKDIPQQHSPEIQLHQETYHTPSPFRTNSSESDSVTTHGSTRGKTPRSARRTKEHYSIMESVNQTVDDSMIPPTNPEDFKIPSAFCSSDEESVIAETQPSVYSRTVHRKGNFNISIPESMREEISLYKHSQIHADNVVEESRITERQFGSDMVGDSENEMDYEEGTGYMPSQVQPGTNLLPDWEEYTIPLKGGEMDRSPVISDKSFNRSSGYKVDRSQGNLSLESEYDVEQSGRNRDYRRMGRWSEGHQSRLQSPGQRSTEGHRRSMQGQRTVDINYSPDNEIRRHDLNQSQRQHSRIETSMAESSRYEAQNRSRNRNLSSRSADMVSRMSSRQVDNILDAVSPARIRSFNDDVDDLYTAQKLEYSRQENLRHQSLPNISGNFSPRISSTQRNITMETNEDEEDRPRSNVTASPVVSPGSSPRSGTSSRLSRSRVLMPSNKDNQSTSASPDGSVRSLSSRSLSSRNSSRLSAFRDGTSQRVYTQTPSGSRYESRALMPSSGDNQSRSVSPSSSARSLSSRNSARHSSVRDYTPQQMLTPVSGGSRHGTPVGSAGHQMRSRDHTPLKTVTPSPVVSPGSTTMNESRSSMELQPSTRKSRTHLGDSEQESLGEEKEMLERSSSSVNRSLSRSRSKGQTPSTRLSTSPVVAGRRLAPDMVNTLPNNTVNFSPEIASTQNLATLSRTGPGAADRSTTVHIDAGAVDRSTTVHTDAGAVDRSTTVHADAVDRSTTVHTDTGVDENDEDNEHVDNDEQWQDEINEEQEVTESRQQSQQSSVPVVEETTPVPKRKKVVRKPRQKSNYSLPVSIVKKHFTHYAGMRVSKEAVEEVMKVSEKYWDIMAKDLEAYAKHAGRKQINMSDFVLLFKRQGHVTPKQSLKSLIAKYLPMEEREKLIPVARAGNRIEPKL